MKKVAIIDYNMGNLLSVARAFEYIDTKPSLTQNPRELLSADIAVLPGVGAFPRGMAELQDLEIIDAINEFIRSGRPLIGICLGMQLLFESSEEMGGAKGLGLLKGQVKKIPYESKKGEKMEVPFIGWNDLSLNKGTLNQKLLNLVAPNESYYFVHSYHATDYDEDTLIASYDYFDYEICAMAGKDNILGCQFHPEKSGPRGLNLLKKFAAL